MPSPRPYHILGDLSARPSIHARQLPDGMGYPCSQLAKSRKPGLSTVMVTLSRVDVYELLTDPFSNGHA